MELSDEFPPSVVVHVNGKQVQVHNVNQQLTYSKNVNNFVFSVAQSYPDQQTRRGAQKAAQTGQYYATLQVKSDFAQRYKH